MAYVNALASLLEDLKLALIKLAWGKQQYSITSTCSVITVFLKPLRHGLDLRSIRHGVAKVRSNGPDARCVRTATGQEAGARWATDG